MPFLNALGRILELGSTWDGESSADGMIFYGLEIVLLGIYDFDIVIDFWLIFLVIVWFNNFAKFRF